MKLSDELQTNIRKKNTDEIESEWNSHVESNPTDLAWFRAVLTDMRAAKLQSKLSDLVLAAADMHAAADRWEPAFDVVREGLVLIPRLREFRMKGLELVETRYASRPDLEDILARFELSEAEEPLKTFDQLRDWLRYEPGATFWLFGRGLGKVAEANLGLSKIQVRFEKAAPLVMRTDEASKLLTWLPAEHFMVRRLEDPAGVKKEAKEDPGAFMRELLECFGRPLTSAEIKECMTGVIEGAAWTAWWNRAKAHPQVLPSPEKRNAFTWSHSAETVERSLLDEFEKANTAQKLDLARKHAKRGGSLMEGIVEGLVSELNRVAPEQSSTAVDLACLLEELGGLPDPSPLALDEILTGPDAAEVVGAVSDRRHRERLWRRVREVHETDWPDVYRDAFFAESDLRIMTSLYEALAAEGPERASEKLVAEAVSNHRRNPRAFVWVVKNSVTRPELSDRANLSLLQKVVDALDSPEFKDLKAPLREQFEDGGLAFVVFDGADRDAADRLLNVVDSANSLEEHRKTAIRRAIFRKYPKIRKRADDDVIYVTAESSERKRKEFEVLVKTEIPQNAEAIRVAREYGDLRENFEYHAARQKHEVLNARAARLSEELNKARLIDAGTVDGSKVTIGAQLTLEPTVGGGDRTVTILGPWDSDPDQGVYSYQSEFAKELLDHVPGDIVELDGGSYRIREIRPWQTPVANRADG
ncbi:MAG: GreA/GreB family elongation factor [Gemmatimonadetes bacterium]|nr:GreA/GreB family elongation factor [Gemmatimonadota bacterium]